MDKFLYKVLAPILTRKQQFSIKMSKLPDRTDRRGEKRPRCSCNPPRANIPQQSSIPTTQKSSSSMPLAKKRRMDNTSSKDCFVTQSPHVNTSSKVMKIGGTKTIDNETGHGVDLLEASGSERYSVECDWDHREGTSSNECVLDQLFPLKKNNAVMNLACTENPGWSTGNKTGHDGLVGSCGRDINMPNSHQSESQPPRKASFNDNNLKQLYQFNESKVLKVAGIDRQEYELGVCYDSWGDEHSVDQSDDDGSTCSVSDARDCSDKRKKKKTRRPRSKPESNYGSNFYNGNESCKRQGLRPIVIDGSNVAMSYTRGKYFSCKALEMCVNFFLDRQHKVYAIVPHFRLCKGQARDQDILDDLFHQGIVFFTPSRMVNGRREVSYDDRYVVQLAASTGGVLVSNDRYRDLLHGDPSWEKAINERLLMFLWVDNMLFFPEDPRGRNGPTLNEFLRF